jgi:hypothetical protein
VLDDRSRGFNVHQTARDERRKRIVRVPGNLRGSHGDLVYHRMANISTEVAAAAVARTSNTGKNRLDALCVGEQ